MTAGCSVALKANIVVFVKRQLCVYVVRNTTGSSLYVFNQNISKESVRAFTLFMVCSPHWAMARECGQNK